MTPREKELERLLKRYRRMTTKALKALDRRWMWAARGCASTNLGQRAENNWQDVCGELEKLEADTDKALSVEISTTTQDPTP